MITKDDKALYDKMALEVLIIECAELIIKKEGLNEEIKRKEIIVSRTYKPLHKEYKNSDGEIYKEDLLLLESHNNCKHKTSYLLGVINKKIDNLGIKSKIVLNHEEFKIEVQGNKTIFISSRGKDYEEKLHN